MCNHYNVELTIGLSKSALMYPKESFAERAYTCAVRCVAGVVHVHCERLTIGLKPTQVDMDDRSSSSSKRVMNKYFLDM